MSTMLHVQPSSLRKQDEQTLSLIRTFITTHIPWLSRSTFELPVYAINGAGHCSVDIHGNIFIDFDHPELKGDKGVGNICTVFITSILKILANTESRRCQGTDRDAQLWDSVSTALSLDIAENIPLPGTYSLPKPPSLRSIRQLSDIYEIKLLNTRALSSEILYKCLAGSKAYSRGQDGTDSHDDSQNPSEQLCESLLREVKEPEGVDSNLSPGELTTLCQQTIDASQEYVEEMPRGVREWIASIAPKAQLSFEDIFRRDVGNIIDTARSGRVSTYRRRSRRESKEFILPGRACVSTDILIGVDVSGSRSDEELSHDFAEITEIAQRRGVHIRYFSISTHAFEIRHLQRGQKPIFDREGGGTDLRSAFPIFDSSPKSVCILFTDGHTPWPVEHRSHQNVVVVITAKTEIAYSRVAQRLPQGIRSLWLKMPWSADKNPQQPHLGSLGVFE